MKTVFVRNIEDANLEEIFLVSAVSSILLIRLFLKFTGYPQLGGGELHIAHMLWGGLLMLAGLVFSLSYLGSNSRRWVAISGGLGFGIFIDELGKFITADNNYFFRPTFALVYLIFIALYLTFRLINRRRLNPEEYIVNSLELIQEAMINGWSKQEKKQAMLYLSKSHKVSISKNLRKIYQEIEITLPQKLNTIGQLKKKLENTYFWLIERNWFLRAVVIFFVLQALIGLLVEIIAVTGTVYGFLPSNSPIRESTLGFNGVLALFSNVISGLLIIAGVIFIRRSRVVTYHFFKRALLVSIFVTQVFTFYEDQLRAIGGLIINILMLAAINYMIDEEEVEIKNTNLINSEGGIF